MLGAGLIAGGLGFGFVRALTPARGSCATRGHPVVASFSGAAGSRFRFANGTWGRRFVELNEPSAPSSPPR